MEQFYTQIPKILSWDTIHPKRNYFSFRWTMRNWSLILAHSNLSARTCDIRKYVRFRPMLISNLPNHRQNQNLEIIPIYIAVLCFPRDNIVWIHLCDECKRSNAPNICHKLLSILCLHEQVSSRTLKCQVYHFQQSTEISEQFERMVVILSWGRDFV